MVNLITMKITSLSLITALTMCFALTGPKSLKAQDMTAKKKVMKADSLFWSGYNSCDLGLQERLIADDIEFYHDKGGVPAKELRGDGKKPRLVIREFSQVVEETVPGLRGPAGLAGKVCRYVERKDVCRESDCNDYVVGDQRSDNWEFAGDSSGIFTRIINKDKLLRVYSAEVDSTEISYLTLPSTPI